MSGEQANQHEQPTDHKAETDGIQLMENESVLHNAAPGWSVWWKQILLAIVVLIGGVGGEAAVGGLAIAGLIFGYVAYSRSKSRYIVTDERIKAQVGFLSSFSMEYRISKLRSLATSQSVFERLLGLGSIEYDAGANNRIVWVGVPDHETISNSVREMQREYE